MLLDEASAYIDKKTEKLMEEAMVKYFGSKTTLVIAHRLDTIRKMDQVMALRRGRVIEKDAPGALEADKNSYLSYAMKKKEPL